VVKSNQHHREPAVDNVREQVCFLFDMIDSALDILEMDLDNDFEDDEYLTVSFSLQ